MDRMFGPEEEWLPMKDAFLPTTDIVETAGRYDITVELPGMKPEDVQVEIDQGRLMIHGAKQEERKEADKTYHRVERRFGQFRRVLPLPGPVDEGLVTARFENGVLRIAVPKAETARAKRIEVKA